MKAMRTAGTALVLSLALLVLIGVCEAAPPKPVGKPTPKPVVAKAAPSALFPAGDNFRWAYVDKTGKVAFSGFYEARDFSDGLALVKMGGRFGYIDTTGKAVIPPLYRQGGKFSEGLAPVQDGRFWGYLDKTGAVVIQPQYIEAGEFSEGLAAVQPARSGIGDKYGAIDAKGALVIKPDYEMMQPCSDGLVAVSVGGKWGFIDKAGSSVINPQFDDAGNFVKGLAPACSGGKWGFINKSGQWVVEAKYDGAKDFREGLAAVGIKNRTVVKDPKTGRIVQITVKIIWGYIDAAGKEVIARQFPGLAGQFSEGLALAWKDDQFGYIDKTGKMVVFLPYDRKEWPTDPGDFHNGLVRMEIGWKYGYIDAAGKMVIPQQFRMAYPFSEDLALVSLDKYEWGYIDRTGKMLVNLICSEPSSFRKGVARTDRLGQEGLIDRTGKFVVKPQFEAIAWYTDKIVAARVHNLWGFFDWTGKVVLEPQFHLVGGLGQDFAIVEKDGKYGFVDAAGRLVVSPQYDDCGWLFAEGLLPVAKDGKFGFVDQTGKMVIAPQYDAVAGFTPEKLCAVKVGTKWGFINTSGKFVIPPQFDAAVGFVGDRAAVKIGGLWGFIDAAGKIVVKPQFKETGYFSCGLASVKVNGKWGYIDKTGKMTIPARFDLARDFHDNLAPVRINGQSAYVNTLGKVVWITQADQLAKQFPGGLQNISVGAKTAPQLTENDLRIVKVKVAVDQIVRKRPDWQTIIENRLRAVSEVLEQHFKIRLVVIAVAPWESPDFAEGMSASSYKGRLYTSLKQDIPLGEAEIVVAYTGQDSRSPVLGFTRSYSNRLIVYDVPAEEERRCVMTSVHEICHMFGATHVNEETSVMYWASRRGQEEFLFDDHSVRQVDLMRDFDFGRGVASLSEDKIRASQALFAEDHGAGESFPVALGYSCLGDELMADRETGEALQAYRKSVALEEPSPSLITALDLAEALLKDDQRGEGLEVLQRCFGLETVPAKAAGCHDMFGDLLDSEYENQVKFITAEPPVLPTLPEIYARYVLTRMDSEKAVFEYRKAVSLEPENAAFHWDLGVALRERGRNAEALAEYQQAVTLKPDNEFYKSRLEALKAEAAPPQNPQ